MLAVMLVMATQKQAGAYTRAPPQKPRLALAHILMAILGIYGGFIQVGVGFLFMPILNKTLGLDMVRANYAQVLYHHVLYHGRPDRFCLAGGDFLDSGPLSGCRYVHRGMVERTGSRYPQGERIIKLVLNTVLALIIIKLLFFN